MMAKFTLFYVPWQKYLGLGIFILNLLKYSCLENLMDRGTWWAAVHGVAKSRTQLSDFTLTFHFHALEKEMATHSSVSCLENPKDRGACWAAIYGVAQSRTQLKRLSSSSSRLVLKDYLLSFLCIIKKKVFIFRVKLFWITFQSKADDVCVFCKILSCKILYH